MSLPHVAVSLSAVCDCGLSCSYPLSKMVKQSSMAVNVYNPTDTVTNICIVWKTIAVCSLKMVANASVPIARTLKLQKDIYINAERSGSVGRALDWES